MIMSNQSVFHILLNLIYKYEKYAYLYYMLFQKDKNVVIVYCRTRDQTEDIANLLSKKGLKALAYHGGNYNITLGDSVLNYFCFHRTKQQ